VKINVIIASRGQHHRLSAVIVSMMQLQSGKNDIEYLVGLDNDDEDSIRAMWGLIDHGNPVRTNIAPRSASLGAINNRLLSMSNADVYLITTDRAFIVTPDWDEVVATVVGTNPNKPFWLYSQQDPDATHPIIPDTFLRAMGGKWSPELFPFWFDDTWLAEIDFFVSGNVTKIPVEYAGKRGTSKRCRDIAFWGDFFAKTRPVRILIAEKIAEKFKGKLLDMEQKMDVVRAMSEEFIARAPLNEERFGDTSPPTPEYLKAKKRAEKILKDISRGRYITP
jgi:hypothetical protein